MKKGIIKVILFYSIGSVLTVLAFLGSGHGHDAGLYPLVIITLTILLGLFWAFLALYNFYFKKKTDERKGMIYSQITVICLIGLGVFYLRYQSIFHRKESKFVPIPEIEDDIQVVSGNDTTRLFYGKTIILLKVKDSVYFDKRDSLVKALKK